jgi:hypothetical protein
MQADEQSSCHCVTVVSNAREDQDVRISPQVIEEGTESVLHVTREEPA